MKKIKTCKAKTVKRKRQSKSRPFAKKRKRFLKIITKIQAGLTLMSLIFYVALGLFLGPPVLMKDLSSKNNALATTIGVYIIGLPEKPIVSATAGCGSDNPYIALNWDDDVPSSTSFDIYRNGNILISGITDSAYQDSTVFSDTSYTYYVIAHGPVGSTVSDEVSATAQNCAFAPTCQITNLAGINLINFQGTPETTDRTPQISGITNLANAQIEIALYTGPIILGSTTANSNGYFSFTVPDNLNYTTHTIFATARDPLDSNRFKQTSLQFIVKEELVEEEKTDAEKISFTPAEIIPLNESSGTLETVPIWPFHFSLEIKNYQKIAYLGQDLLFNIRLYDPQKDTDLSAIPLKFQIFDTRGKIVWEAKETQNFLKNLILTKSIPLSYELKTGTYQLKVTTALQNTGYSLSAEDSFTLQERPIIEVGSFSATATGILNYAGWILFILVLILLFFLTLLYIEHQLALRALIQITEYDLKKGEYIS